MKIFLPHGLDDKEKVIMNGNKCSSSLRRSSGFRVKYLHILHGHNVHAALGASLHPLGAERVHDDDRLQDRHLALLAYLEEGFCFLLIVTKNGGDPRWRKQMSERLSSKLCTNTSHHVLPWHQFALGPYTSYCEITSCFKQIFATR